MRAVEVAPDATENAAGMCATEGHALSWPL